MSDHTNHNGAGDSPPPVPDAALEDPHRSRIDPDDPRLKIANSKGRSLKKGPIIILTCSVVAIIVLAFTFALLPSAMKAGRQEVEEEPAAPSNPNTVPDFIKNAPDNSDPVPVVHAAPPVPDHVPPLGEKLPGDLGNAMVEPAQKPTSRPASASSAPKPLTEAEKARRKAMHADVFFKSGGSDSPAPVVEKQAMAGMDKMIDAYKTSMESMTGAGASKGGGGVPYGGGGGGPDQNKQGDKKAFIDGVGSKSRDYVKGGVMKPRSPYEVKAGTVIPVSLVTGINSDLPGEVIGQVRENVYDTVSGNHLLIPQGSRVLAVYDSGISYGQDRVLVCWNRLIRPDGSSISLDCMPGVELDGSGGFTGKVNNHYLRLVGGVLISSLLSATTTKSQGNQVGGDNLTFDQIFASNVGSNISDVGQQITAKNLEVQPTIEVPAGDSVVVLVNKDMIIPPYETP